MVDVCSHSLGILECTPDGEWRNHILIKKNTPIPTHTKVLLHPRLHFPLRITQGEEEDPDRVYTLGETTFADSGERLLLSIGYDLNGIITLEVTDGSTRRVVGNMQLDRSANLTEELVATGAAKKLQEQAGEIEVITFDLVNEIRTGHGLHPLSQDSKVTRAARLHSGDMATRNYFSHYSPEGSTCGDRLRNAGVQWHNCGENIYQLESEQRHLVVGRVSVFQPLEAKPIWGLAQTAVDGWFHSKGHRENMLSASFSATGVGVAVTGARYRYTVYFTQNFSA